MSGFRKFILRGNVVDLAVGIVVGAAFGTVVTALVKDFLTPVVAAVGGKPNFGGLYFTVNRSRFAYGDFLNAVVSFLLIAAVVYYFVVLPVNTLMSRYGLQPEPDAPTKDCPRCLSAIPEAATRCAHCTADL